MLLMPSEKMPNPASKRFEAIGTQWEIATNSPLDAEQWQAVQQTIGAFDATYSRFRPDSLVSQIAQKPGTYTFPENFEQLFSLYEKLYDATDGCVTPLIGDTLADIGYDATYSLKPQNTIRSSPPLSSITRHGSTITTFEPVTIDVGAAGKGFLVDEVATLLDTFRLEYVIDASGDIRVSSSRNERIGLENPHDASRVIGVANVQGQSLCGSAPNRRTWGDGLHHIINPHTSKPVHGVQATWVVADTAFVADGLATALFFTDPARLQDFEFTYVRLMDDNTLQHSTDFSGELFV
jgi:thiamine biosynthesis lipoprotein